MMTSTTGGTRRERAVYWIFGVLFTVLIGLVSVVYANIQKEIDLKADKDIVVHLLQTTDEIQSDIKTILREMPRR
jgi:cell division septal protein FtsQ